MHKILGLFIAQKILNIDISIDLIYCYDFRI